MNKKTSISAPDKYFDRLGQYSTNISEAIRIIIDEHEMMCDHLAQKYIDKYSVEIQKANIESPLDVTSENMPNISNKSVYRIAIVGAAKRLVSRMSKRPKK